jgi:hypothetical protein
MKRNQGEVVNIIMGIDRDEMVVLDTGVRTSFVLLVLRSSRGTKPEAVFLSGHFQIIYSYFDNSYFLILDILEFIKEFLLCLQTSPELLCGDEKSEAKTASTGLLSGERPLKENFRLPCPTVYMPNLDPCIFGFIYQHFDKFEVNIQKFVSMTFINIFMNNY